MGSLLVGVVRRSGIVRPVLIEPPHRRIEAPCGNIGSVAHCGKLLGVTKHPVRHRLVVGDTGCDLVLVCFRNEGADIDHAHYMRFNYRAVNGYLTAARTAISAVFFPL